MSLSRWSCIVLFSLATLNARAETQIQTGAPRVASFSPQGASKNVRQVRASFSAAMVAFGDLQARAPFEASCSESGSSRWVDERNWVYEFAHELHADAACSFTLRPGLTDLAGAALEGPRSFSFATGAPGVVEALPSEGAHVADDQIFMLALDGLAEPAAIEKNSYCSAAGVEEKIGVRVIEGAQRDEIIKLRKYFVERHLRNYYGTPAGAARTPAATPGPLVLVQCRRTLPADARVELVWAERPGAGQHLHFVTRPDFSATFSCTRASPKAPCVPLLPLTVRFSAPLAQRDARAVALQESGGQRRVYPVQREREGNGSGSVDEVRFSGPFAENATLQLSLPAGLKDDAGRPLVNAARFPLTVHTGPLPPLLKFPARFGILEAHGQRLLPVTVRNLEPGLAARVANGAQSAPPAPLKGSLLRLDAGQDEKIIAWMQRLGARRWSARDSWEIGETGAEQLGHSIFDASTATTPLRMPAPGAVRAGATEVVGIPLKKTGFYVVELASPKLGAALNEKGGIAWVQTAALVTNLAAHFKRGAESSLVWVTTLDTASPVPGAAVAVRDCHGKLLWQGATGKDGIARIASALQAAHCPNESQFFVSARSKGDMTFTLSDWVGGIETYRFNVPTDDPGRQTLIATSVLDRTLLRAGETVHMKHFLRRHTGAGLALPPAQPAAAQLVLLHVGSGKRYTMALAWAADGSAESAWSIPADAPQGVYEIMAGGRSSGSFRVEQFRVPSMKALLQAPRTALVGAERFALDVQLNYLSGGAAAHAPVRLRTVVEERDISFAAYPGVSFDNGDVVAGMVREGGDDDEGDASESSEAGALHRPVRTRNVTLDGAGAARIEVDGLTPGDRPQSALAELEYQDANGEVQTASTRVALWPAALALGIRAERWTGSATRVRFEVLALSVDGKPQAGVEVAADFFRRVSYSHRRRLLGGFYAYENSSEIVRLGPACEGRTDAKGVLACDVAAPASGNLIVRARASDGAGRSVAANHDVWVTGADEWWFRASDSDRIDLLPERSRYEPGENASFQVRMPFRSATALITVEREGILDTYVRRLSGKQPTFTIPVKGNYAPNMFVSALVVRGRVAGVQPTALVDLGKPAYKMGVARLDVGWRAHELKVAVETDRAVYPTRASAHARIRVTLPDGHPAPAGTEVALAAVDAGLLELMPNDSWKLLEAMMATRGLQVQTSTAQMQVIGKRHFGRKAIAHGGGGGRSGGRELFETLLLWRGRVALDARGEAGVEVPLNDSLSAFRIVAVANAGADRFGTGSADIRTSQDLIITAGLAPLVRDGDRQHAVFSVRNTTGAAQQLSVTATLDAGEPGKPAARALAPQRLTLAPGQAAEVAWDVTVPAGATSLQWDVAARAAAPEQSGPAPSDRLHARQRVIAAVPLRTYQATLLQLDPDARLRVQAPAGALPGHGGVRTELSAHLGQALPGVRDYMRAYPYSCFEQLSSKALALGDAAQWRTNMAALPGYLDDDGLLKYFAPMQQGSEVLTAYVLSAAAEAGYPVALELRERMEQALTAFVEGKLKRSAPFSAPDLVLRKLAALEALSRSGKVRPELLESIAPAPAQWPTSALLDWYLIHQRSPALAQRETRMLEAEQLLRARLNFNGSMLDFSGARQDRLWWLMVSPDENASRLLLAMLDNPRWQADLGRIARGTLARQQHGHWDTTVANAWGVLALDKFSKKFETQAVSGRTTLTLAGATRTLDWPAAPDGGTALTLPWPAGAGELALAHSGSGRPWAMVQSVAALPLAAPQAHGYAIRRTVTPVTQQHPGSWTRGDVYRVRLELDAQADMSWVVVEDPVPAGATILGKGLGGESHLPESGGGTRGRAWPAWEERREDVFRAYYEYVPRGGWSVEYTVRLNSGGQFALPPTHVEAMYAPEMMGELPNRAIHVEP